MGKYILRFIFVLSMFNNLLIANIHLNNCKNINNFEYFRIHYNEKLKNFFSDLDIEIYNRLFQMKDLKLIQYNEALHTTTCEVTYKFNPITKEEANAYLFISQNKNFNFKKVIEILANGKKNEIQNIEDKINEIITNLPPTTYTIDSFNNDYYVLIVNNISFLELIDKINDMKQ